MITTKKITETNFIHVSIYFTVYEYKTFFYCIIMIERLLKRNALPSDLTSYDFLKFLAIVLTIVDHVGHYFYPEENMFRFFGRFCVPIWFFLIGYSKGRNVGSDMWGGAIILVIASIIAGMAIFPLNILFLMLLIRLTLDPIMNWLSDSVTRLVLLSVPLLLLAMPSYFVMEYGTSGFILAILGYMVRHKDCFAKNRGVILGYVTFSSISFAFLQNLSYGFSQDQMIFLSGGLFALTYLLTMFKPMVFSNLTSSLPKAVTTVLQLFGRRTLEIYVLHLVLFKFIALVINPERFSLFEWEWLTTGDLCSYNSFIV